MSLGACVAAIAIMSALSAAAARAQPCDCLDCPTDAEGFVAVPVLGVVGLLTGALLGSLSTRRVTVLPPR